MPTSLTGAGNPYRRNEARERPQDARARGEAVFPYRMLRVFLVGGLAMAGLLPVSANPSDWPNYMGLNKNSTSPDPTPLADSWPEEGPPELWSIEVHPGHGGAAIVDGKVYMMDREHGQKDLLKVIDLKTGKLLQEKGIEKSGRVNFPGARGVPTVTEDRIYTCGPMGVVAAWNRADLSLAWSVDLVKSFKAEPMFFGYAVHPQVYGDLVIISSNAPDASVIALKAETGELVWKTGGLYGSLASPVIQKFQGRDQVFYISQELPEDPGSKGKYSVAGLDPKSGDILWRYENFRANIPIPPPVVIDDQTLFVTGAYKAGSQLLRFGGGKNPKAQVTTKWGSHICPPILHQGHIYFLAHENETLKSKRLWPEVGLHCLTADGKLLWNSGAEPMFGRGSMILADGKLLIRDSYFGKLYLVKPDPNGFKLLASANPFDNKRRDLKQWSPLAISGGLLVIRDQREVKCLDLRKR